jgi:hypothetical protein
MGAGGIPESVRRLIADHVKSVEQLEVLLLLRAHPDRDWSGEEVSRTLQSQPESAAARLADLAARGFCAPSAESEARYRYAPATAALARAVDELADCYARRRHTVITLIFESPSDAIQSFADAFRLRKDR